jgi:hypothetical protein
MDSEPEPHNFAFLEPGQHENDAAPQHWHCFRCLKYCKSTLCVGFFSNVGFSIGFWPHSKLH